MKLRKPINVVIFGGANEGNIQLNIEAAYNLGQLLAAEGFTVVNGGGGGIMTEVAHGAADAGGWTISVNLAGQKPHSYHKEYFEKKGIHARQSALFSMGDAFIALPGGTGTMYEILEIVELKKLKEDAPEPVIILNIDGFYNDLKNQLVKMRAAEYIAHSLNQKIVFVDTPEEAVAIIKSFYRAIVAEH